MQTLVVLPDEASTLLQISVGEIGIIQDIIAAEENTTYLIIFKQNIRGSAL